MKKITTVRRVLASSIMAMSAVGHSAWAADIALEEIVVTAQKRAESAQDTPISMAAFDTGLLEEKGINNLEDLRANVPNLQITPHPNSAGTAQVFIRGIGVNDDQVTQDPSVAVYMDGVYLGRTQGLVMDIAELERVEVLRGPQGTLYGRNATGGAINFITAAPLPGDFGFKQQVTAGNRNLLRSKTSANLPLGDNAAVGLSYLRSVRDGFVDNEGTGEDRFGDQDRQAYRVDFLWQASDAVQLRYAYDRSEVEDTPAFAAAVPLHPEQGKRPDEGSPFVENLRANDIVSEGHSVTATWDINDSLALKSITAYRELENFQNQDYLTGVEPFPPFTGFTLPLFKNFTNIEQDQFSQELQLVGDAFDSRLEYVAGLYYFDESGKSSGGSTRFFFSDLGAPVTIDQSRTSIDNKAYAVYGQASWNPPVLDDSLKLTLGLRWSKDEREATRWAQSVLLSDPSIVVEGPDAAKGDEDFSNVSPSLIVHYDITPDVGVYGKVTKGYKTGGYNTRASSTESFERGFDEETLVAYELGLKSQWFDNRLRLNLAAFQSDYKDIQINVQTDPGNPSNTDVLNAGEATMKGVELDVTWRATTRLTAELHYAYLDPDYDEIIEPATGNDIADDFRFINSPKHSYTADLRYDIAELPFGNLSANVNYTWQDEKFTSSSIDQGEYIVDDYGLLNARLSLTEIPMPAGNLKVALWGRNLEDKEYYIAHFDLRLADAAVFGEPRTYGIDLTYEY